MPEERQENIPRAGIRSISVKKLFGIFSYTVPLDSDGHITIIHGRNGVGKTVMLQMLHNLLTGTTATLRRVQFEEFSVELVDERRLVVSRPKKKKPRGRRGWALMCRVIEADGDEKTVDLLEELIDPAVAASVAHLLPGDWEYIGDARWRDSFDGEVLGRDEALRRCGPRLPRTVRRRLSEVPPVTLGVVTSRFVKTDRLRGAPIETDPRVNPNRYGRRGDPVSTAVSHAADLSRRIQGVRTDYGSLSARLDGTFVPRLVTETPEASEHRDGLVAALNRLEKKRQHAGALGLLDLEQGPAVPINQDRMAKVVNEKADVFSLYIQDMEQKLQVFDHLRQRLDVLRDSINRRFSYKKIVIDNIAGLSFISDSGLQLDPDSLSSGEQHLLILMYEVLFLAEPGELLIIDEPEISLHVEWQLTFLEDLAQAQKVSGVSILVATHSAAIAGSAGSAGSAGAALVALPGPTEHQHGGV